MIRRNLLKLCPFVATFALPAVCAQTPGSQGAQAPQKDLNHGLRKIGLIGGIGPESTVPYYRRIVYGVQEQAKVFPKLTVESLNVFDVLKLSSAKDYDALEEYIMDGINNLVRSNVEAIAMTGNTPHVILDRLQKQCPVPIISIVQATADRASQQKIKKAALLGTISTMNADFFLNPFKKNGIEIIVPNDKEKKYINDKIGQELELGVVKPETRAEFLKIIDQLQKEEGAEAIILGCTELPLLFEGQEVPFNCLDTRVFTSIRSLISF